ncbi:putative Protein REDUCED WALL ACETYLATION 4 [Nannochloris sp. 'desiccata']|nr:hypothetical protein KSW81_000267 [Chlorella desiccata (nom. nud.)]KAH7620109.1 putative Protein REDUCED WALL ACETYLATION 4 [Chlorella desiccata (nom. nud.)]
MGEVEVIGGPITAAQAACLIAYILFVALWSYAELLAYRGHQAEAARHPHSDATNEEEMVPIMVHGDTNGTLDSSSKDAMKSAAAPTSSSDKNAATAAKDPSTSAATAAYSSRSSGFIQTTFFRLLALDPLALSSCREALRASVEMGTIILWFYVADRTPAIAAGPKEYIRDVFLFMFLVLTLVAGSYTLKKGRAPVLVNRQQTEEWKGWMQVLFLLYHYYEAREAYNAIRIFIASYVWMTGFGNFAYYYKTRDFSLGRFCQMMWRLNFLAFLCCAALDNQYMLYYICPMHTLYTIMVYAALGLWRGGNDSLWGLGVKIFLCFGVVIGVWEIKSVFYAMWAPFQFLLGYTDPRRPNPDAMHEWYFRTGLDRYIWIHGMICAYLHPKFEAWLKSMDTQTPTKRRAIRALLAVSAVTAGYVWYVNVYTLPKLEYNKLHPFTSWIPITAFLTLRNITPSFRLHAMGLYGWLGCITLETYVAQYHTWLLSKVPNSQPIYLLTLLPGYPLLNFSAVTAIYIFLSHRMFELTASLRDALIPHDDDALLGRNLATMSLGAAALWGIGFLVKEGVKAL